MKKAQLRANLLDESAPFAGAPNGRRHHSHGQGQGHRQDGHRVHSNGEMYPQQYYPPAPPPPPPPPAPAPAPAPAMQFVNNHPLAQSQYGGEQYYSGHQQGNYQPTYYANAPTAQMRPQQYHHSYQEQMGVQYGQQYNGYAPAPESPRAPVPPAAAPVAPAPTAPTSMAQAAKAVLKPRAQIFAIGDDEEDEEEDEEEDDGDEDVSFLKKKTMSTISAVSGTSFDQEKIQQLEEKIQRLERVLALQSLEEKEKEKEKEKEMPKEKPKPKEVATVESDVVAGAPPLPPPPPPEKRSLMNSPKASLFKSEFTSISKASLADVKNDALRLSASSLIPSEKSTGDDEDDEEDEEDDTFGDEPPPSYEELEKSGTITYSKSIYRTGFEKAGYQMDHVQTPTHTPVSAREKDAEKYRMLGIEKGETKGTSAPTPTPPVKAERLMSKRKIPSQIEFEKPKEAVVVPESVVVSVPAPAPVPSAPAPAPTPATSTFIKYSTPWSYETLPNGVIRPILPSKSDVTFENIVSKFRKTREKALADYKQFTPNIQFQWAILLLETLSKNEVMSLMTIDGKVRKNALVGSKKVRKQRLLFLTTSVKVLEKLVQIAPNETRARLYLGDIYSGGIHPGLIEKDERRGFELFYDCAIKQMDPVGCYRVACCFESGVGCSKIDIMKSVIFFEKGATLGDPSCMCQLGMMHFAGVNGCLQDINLSIAYHRQAYDTLRSKTIMGNDPLISARSFQDARGALYTLAKMHQTDVQILCLQGNDEKTLKTIRELKENGVWYNRGKALKYYLESAKLGHCESQACLGYYYSQGYFPTYMFKSDKNGGHADMIDARKSIYWFSKAASEGHTYASLGLARWYGSGGIDNEGKIVLRQDEQQAFLWGRKAADGGELMEAEFMIGMCFEQGFGVEKNLVMAFNYYERSARKGYKKAISKLKRRTG